VTIPGVAEPYSAAIASEIADVARFPNTDRGPRANPERQTHAKPLAR
jgi:hypothetical protein